MLSSFWNPQAGQRIVDCKMRCVSSCPVDPANTGIICYVLSMSVVVSYFNSAYRGLPPWDIGHPQREILQLAEKGEIRGRVLDVGCGTGENALYLAGLGLAVWGVDAAPAAIRKAKGKARRRATKAEFLVADALKLSALPHRFDTAIDSGLFHVFSDEERPIFAASLHSALNPGGTYFMLCFSEHQPGSSGPRRVTQAEIRATFGQGWRINFIREAVMEATIEPKGVKAWLCSITRL